MPHGLLNKLKCFPNFQRFLITVQKAPNSGPVTEIIETSNPTLVGFTILKSFPNDSGRFITFGITVTKNPETDVRNMG